MMCKREVFHLLHCKIPFLVSVPFPWCSNSTRLTMSFTVQDLDNIDNDQLIKVIESLMDEIKLMKVENVLNERFLHKNDPELLNGLTATLDVEKRKTKIQFAESVQDHQTENINIRNALQTDRDTINSSENSRNASITESLFGSTSRTSRAASTASSAGTFGAGRQPMSLSLVIKADICEAECKLERTVLNVFEQKMKTRFCELLAEVEEIKLTTKDLNHATEMFNDFVIAKGMNPVTMQVPLERFLKFIRNYNKNGTIAIEKMRLKSVTLESNYTDKKLELQQRMDMSSILRPVDFEQLKIDIKTLTSSLEEKTANMMGLKSINGNISIQLVDERRQLSAIEDRLHNYREKCKIYRRETEQMCEKIVKIENDIAHWTNLVEELNEKILCYTAPSFNTYFELKIQLRNTRKEENRLKRKRNIALIKLKNIRPKKGIKHSFLNNEN